MLPPYEDFESKDSILPSKSVYMSKIVTVAELKNRIVETLNSTLDLNLATNHVRLWKLDYQSSESAFKHHI